MKKRTSDVLLSNRDRSIVFSFIYVKNGSVSDLVQQDFWLKVELAQHRKDSEFLNSEADLGFKLNEFGL